MPDTKTSNETAASALTGSELVRIVQSGNNRRTTTQAIADLGGAAGATSLDELSDVVITSPNNGQVLAYDTGVSPPVWKNSAAGASGALLLISTLTASGSAQLEWTGLATQTTWKLVGRLLVPATNNVSFNLVVGTGAGPTYITSGYTFARKVETSAPSAADDGSGSFSAVPLDDGGLTNATTPGTSFEMEIITNNSTFVHFLGKSYSRNTSPNDVLTIVGGKVAISAAITAIKISMSSGNIASGKASLYSLAE